MCSDAHSITLKVMKIPTEILTKKIPTQKEEHSCKCTELFLYRKEAIGCIVR